jgi:hypothetical protein
MDASTSNKTHQKAGCALWAQLEGLMGCSVSVSARFEDGMAKPNAKNGKRYRTIGLNAAGAVTRPGTAVGGRDIPPIFTTLD